MYDCMHACMYVCMYVVLIVCMQVLIEWIFKTANEANLYTLLYNTIHLSKSLAFVELYTLCAMKMRKRSIYRTSTTLSSQEKVAYQLPETSL